MAAFFSDIYLCTFSVNQLFHGLTPSWGNTHNPYTKLISPAQSWHAYWIAAHADEPAACPL